jgi:hypothetical protein
MAGDAPRQTNQWAGKVALGYVTVNAADTVEAFIVLIDGRSTGMRWNAYPTLTAAQAVVRSLRAAGFHARIQRRDDELDLQARR